MKQGRSTSASLRALTPALPLALSAWDPAPRPGGRAMPALACPRRRRGCGGASRLLLPDTHLRVARARRGPAQLPGSFPSRCRPGAVPRRLPRIALALARGMPVIPCQGPSRPAAGPCPCRTSPSRGRGPCWSTGALTPCAGWRRPGTSVTPCQPQGKGIPVSVPEPSDVSSLQRRFQDKRFSLIYSIRVTVKHSITILETALQKNSTGEAGGTRPARRGRMSLPLPRPRELLPPALTGRGGCGRTL